MKIKHCLKKKKENLIIIFLSGQVFYIRLSIILSNFLNIYNKPKYDFSVY
jgi:hypothetical protein